MCCFPCKRAVPRNTGQHVETELTDEVSCWLSQCMLPDTSRAVGSPCLGWSCCCPPVAIMNKPGEYEAGTEREGDMHTVCRM